MPFTVGILTVSDRCYLGQTEDKSGEAIENEFKVEYLGKAEVVIKACVPDETLSIQEKLIEWSKDNVNLIITTGGTGFAPRDVTPEATKAVIEKEANGMSMALISGSLKITPFAMLSRLVCGIRNRTLIVNFPGSPKACTECLLILRPILCHAIDVIRSEPTANELHEKMISKPNTGCDRHQCHSKVDISKVANRKRHSPYPMILVKDAQTIILNAITIQPPTTVDIKDALGYILQSDIYAKEPFPPFRASVKDGYAVIASDGAGKRKVVSGSIAGESSQKLVQPGECIRVTTGAPIPQGADAVIQVEDTKLISADSTGTSEIEIEILKAPRVGLDIREIGSDIEQNTLLLNAGNILTPSALGILATVGVCQVPVVSRPKIGILSTGNEIQEPQEELSFGKIRDSNKITLITLLKEYGYDAVDFGIVIDEPTVVLNKIQTAIKEVDILVTSGGVSMGERDILTDVMITDLKATLHFGRINMKPGKPTKFFSIPFENGKKFLFGLPGNPVSATVTCHLFVLPALKRMSGVLNPSPTIIKAQLCHEVTLDDRYEYARGICYWVENDPVPWVTLAGNQISSRMLSMVHANCLIYLPVATETINSLPIGHILDAEIIGKW
ncbi:gephyrin [Planococcus citri]|uniref:gephyrin n=1 Tax=Planococcus citri TaxID=170843 RepID=UPI0031F8539D